MVNNVIRTPPKPETTANDVEAPSAVEASNSSPEPSAVIPTSAPLDKELETPTADVPAVSNEEVNAATGTSTGEIANGSLISDNVHTSFTFFTISTRLRKFEPTTFPSSESWIRTTQQRHRRNPLAPSSCRLYRLR